MIKQMFPAVFKRYENFEFLGFQKETGDHTIFHLYFKQGDVTIHHLEHVF